jgi:deoxyribodipyrimidine photo-lyase
MQTKQNNISLVWFKNNLRVQDNMALNTAIKNSNHIIAIFVFDLRNFELTKFGFKKTEKFRSRFLIETVNNLKQNLKKLNIELFVYKGYSENHVSDLIKSYNIQSIYFEKEFTHEELKILEKVKKTVPKSVIFNEEFDQFLFHPEDLASKTQTIPEVFTNFRKKIETSCKVRPTVQNKDTETILNIKNTTTIPTLEELGFTTFKTQKNSAFPFEGGESSALERLDDYFFKTQNISVYKKTRNGLIGTDYSSKLSPWLANGSISARTIYWKLKDFEDKYHKNDSTYWLFFELIWRDFFKYIALKHGNDIFKIGGVLNKSYHWNYDQNLVSNWINGKTASPFVNANMIELKKTGWMSNRGRQNVASFFSKNLQLDWRIGAAYFESMLIDYDVHSNYGNWMYVSGVGNDTRDRVFNVSFQADRYDANGTYQNLWLQETLF